MKRSLLFVALVSVLVLASLAGGNTSAWATPPCSSIHGTACSPNGATTSCITDDGFVSSCRCRLGHWMCLL